MGLETAPIKSFVSKTRFVSLGSYCALPSIAGKLQIEVIEVTLHGARELSIFIWPVVAANGVIVLCMVVFCLELLMPRALIPGVCNKQLEQTDFANLCNMSFRAFRSLAKPGARDHAAAQGALLVCR